MIVLIVEDVVLLNINPSFTVVLFVKVLVPDQIFGKTNMEFPSVPCGPVSPLGPVSP